MASFVPPQRHVRIKRASYPVVGPRTHIRPHFGETNAELTLHLGLLTPSRPNGEPCARFRVGENQPSNWRPWKRGEVLFFDDSYSHEARNECEEGDAQERVVLLVRP